MTALSPFRFRLTLTGVFLGVVALTIMLLRVVARADVAAAPVPTAGLDWTLYVGIALGALAGLDVLLRGLSMVIRSFAKHTANTVDDRIADGIDSAHDKLDELIGVLGRIAPKPQVVSGRDTSGPPTSSGSGSAAMLAVLLLGAVALPSSGCAASTRESTIRAALVTVDASKEAYATYDAHAQDEIVAKATSLDDGKAKLTEYRTKRGKAIKAFVVAYQAIATAAQLNDDHSLASVAAAISEVIATVRALTGGAS